MLIETGFGQILIIAGIVTLMAAAFALWLPVRGLHTRIRQLKQEELDYLNREISTRRSSFQSSDSSRTSGEMADFVTYRGLIERVSEWPFTTSTYTRLFLYALLPVASWGIGIVAEEIVGRAFL